VINEDAALYSRYMDVLRRLEEIVLMRHKLLLTVNRLNSSLKFTVEKEANNSIAFLDMEIHHQNNKLVSTWHTKSTDTGLIMNYHALESSELVAVIKPFMKVWERQK